MFDDDRPSPTGPVAGGPPTSLLPLDTVAARFTAAGLPRSLRSLQRYCQNGTLTCVKEATATGDAFFVNAQSIEAAITTLKQLHNAKHQHRPGSPESDIARSVGHEDRLNIGGGDDRHSPTPTDDDRPETKAPDRLAQPDTARYVAQLEARLDEKDAEIGFLREELIDRRGQIRDMKGIIDGQNQLLETIQTNVAPIFNALAATVETKRINVTSVMGRQEKTERSGENPGEQGRGSHTHRAHDVLANGNVPLNGERPDL